MKTHVGWRIAAVVVVLVAVAGFWFVARAQRRAELGETIKNLRLERLRGSVAQIVARLRADVEVEPTDAERWGNLGFALYGNEWPKEAELCFAQAERCNPGDARWPHALGAAAVPRDADFGVAVLRRAWQLAPREPNLAATLIETVRQSGDANAAASLAEECALHGSDSPRLLLAAARAFEELGMHRRAYELTRQARKFAETNADFRESAHLLIAAGLCNPNESRLENRRLALLPREAVVHHAWSDPVFAPSARYVATVTATANRLQTLAFEGKTDEAQGVLEKLPEEERRDLRIRAAEALVRLRMVQTETAESIVRAGLAEAPDDLGMTFAKAYIRLAAQKFADAEAAFAAVVKLDPASHAAHYSRGLCLLKLQRPRDALAAFDAALAIWPGKPEALEASARLLDELGDAEKAKARREDLAIVRRAQ